MIRALAGDQELPIDVNSTKTLVAAIYISIIGPAVFIVQPGFVQGLVEYYHFSEQQAGYIASAEMWGIAITTLVMILLTGRINWRYIMIWSVLLVVAGNLLSTTTKSFVLFAALRCMTGIGSGVLVSLTFTIIGLSANPDRNFGYMIMWILLYGALGFLAMPTAYTLVGMDGVLVFFALFTLSALPFIRYLPSSGEEHGQVDAAAVNLTLGYRVMAVATMFVYFLAQGAVWAYLFLIGVSGGGSEQEVSNGLTLSQFAGVAGAFTAATLGIRWGRIIPLIAGVAGSIVSLFFLFGEMGALLYAIAVCVFNYAWNLVHPFLLASMASFDRSGKIVVHGVAGQMLGLAIGPALAASVIMKDNYNSVIWLGMGLFAMSLLLILPPLIQQKKKVRAY